MCLIFPLVGIRVTPFGLGYLRNSDVLLGASFQEHKVNIRRIFQTLLVPSSAAGICGLADIHGTGGGQTPRGLSCALFSTPSPASFPVTLL